MACRLGRSRRFIVIFSILLSTLAACSSQPGPIPSPTVAPPSTAEDALTRYDGELRPLAESIQTTQSVPQDSSLLPIAEQEVGLVPFSERLYYVQSVLFPDLGVRRSTGSAKLYLGYGYERGEALGGEVLDPEEYAHTQEVIAKVRLVTEVDGKLYLVGEKQGVGGAGNRSYEELVRQAVERLEVSGETSEQVEHILESVLGYAVGLDWNKSLEIGQRVSLLRWTLGSPYWADRKQAAEALGQIGPKAQDALPDLTKALLDPESRVCIAAVEALGQIGPAERVIPILIAVLGDDDPGIGLAASEALARIGPEAIPALIEALKHDTLAQSAAIREGAAEALGLIGPEAREAVPALIQSLQDECSYVRHTARYALKEITGQDFVTDYAGWIRYWGK